jgi:hypothetical protein
MIDHNLGDFKIIEGNLALSSSSSVKAEDKFEWIKLNLL